MVDLKPQTALRGLVPVEIGQVRLTELDPGVVTLLSPFKGQDTALSQVIKETHGMSWPAPNRTTSRAGARLIWFGLSQALLVGPDPNAKLADYAAIVEQSDAWAVAELRGARAVDVLMRLTPIDLRPAKFKRGHTARSELAHMAASITKTGEQTFQIMVYRSFARSLIHEFTAAMEGVAARHAD